MPAEALSFPVRAASPLEDIVAIQAVLRSARREITVDFEGGGGSADIQLRDPDGQEAEAVGERLLQIATMIIESEIDNWTDGPGASGTIRFDGDAPWIDADDRGRDWSLERCFEIENLEFSEWPDSDTPAERPEV